MPSEGYDLASCVYSPDGIVYQVEYAQKPVKKSGNIIAIAWNNGVLVVADREVPSKLHLEDTQKRISNVTSAIGFSAAGLYSDCQALLDYAQWSAMKYLRAYRTPICVEKLADEVGSFVYDYTTGTSRPFGSEVILAGWTPKGASLYVIDTTGLTGRYRAYATGKDCQVARASVEKLVRESGQITIHEMRERVLKIIKELEPKRDNHRIDIGWASVLDGGKFQVGWIWMPGQGPRQLMFTYTPY